MTLPNFKYDRHAAMDIREAGTRQAEGFSIRNFTYDSPFQHRRAAYYVSPTGEGPFPVILYVHWYEPQSPDSNRTQFLEEAKTMAQRGAASLLIETLWSDRDWFIKRAQANDYEDSRRQVIELSQAMDLLLAQAHVDPSRFAYVGHDFGAMYGALMGSIDPRPTCYVLMAGTPKFPDWYLYYPPLTGNALKTYRESMAPLDPQTNVAKLAPAPLLFQFANDDEHVSKEKALAFYDAAADPKQIKWYAAGHGLNAKATQERIAWLAEQLGLAQE